MTGKLIVWLSILIVIFGCEDRSPRVESRVITDVSKPQLLSFPIMRDHSNVTYKIVGEMDGTLGYYSACTFDSTDVLKIIKELTISRIDTNSKRRFMRIFSDSIVSEGGNEGSTAGTNYFLRFIPGTARKGRIEVEFREYGYGF